MSRLRVEGGDSIYFVSPELYPVGHPLERLYSRKYVHGISAYPKAAALEVQLIVHIQRGDKLPEQLIPTDSHSLLDMDYLLGERSRIGHAIETGHGGYYNHIPPSGQKRSRGTQAELIDFIVNG